ncbi:6241_t:CDS:2, partial [Rhizophagus irregularis]
NSLVSRSIMIRCRTAQLRLAIHDNIFEHESESLFLGHQEAKSNLSLHNIIIARKLNIVIQQDYINRTIWAISGGKVCNIKICSDNPQKAIIQKQECLKIITIAQHNALVLPIFTRLSTGAITHIDWYYMVDSVNRVENITTNIDIQQMEKTPTIELNGDNLGPWINRWIEQDTLRQELTNI